MAIDIYVISPYTYKNLESVLMTTESNKIRKAACAGTWYPKSPVELSKLLAGYFSEVKKIPLEGEINGIIVPHAGYTYSGKTAARAYKQLEGKDYETVVIISPSHHVFFKGSAVFDGDGYETPLGLVEIDKELSEKIGTILPSVYLSNMGHGGGGSRGEHALELQLPFLQIVLGRFKLVAIVMGDQEEDSVNALGEVLATALTGKNALLVASTDLSHFHSEKEANRLDGEVCNAIKNYDADLLMDKMERGKAEACGGGIIASVITATKRLGGKRTEFLEYTTSGAVTGDFDEVVGYLSAVIVEDKQLAKKMNRALGLPAAKPKEVFKLTDADKQQLLTIAEKAVEAKLKGKDYTPPMIEHLNVNRGLFVTLKINNELRGCIGYIKAKQALFDAVAEMAVAAAFDDPRFPELTQEEFEQLEFEVSVLSSLKRVHDIEDIRIGRDGLLIKFDMHSGLLLPQVATEYGWSVREFVEQTCLKAGLPKNSYKQREAELYRFEADVF